MSVGYNVFMSEKNNKEEKKNNNKKKTGLGLAIWILAALVLLILFLVYQDRIVSNLKQADFFHRVFGKTPEFVEKHEDKTPVKDNDKNDVAPIDINALKNNSQENQKKSEEINKVPAENEKETEPVENESNVVATNEAAKTQQKEAAAEKEKQQAEDAEKKSEAKKEKTKTTETVKKETPVVSTMNIKLCFMEIDSDGSVDRHEVTRKMKKSDSPLVDAVNALISGPNADEESSGCRSLIPSGSKLIGASVKNGVATLNFNEQFEFNQYGVEGTLGQLQQIVFTATAFPSVESVQFLIEGQKNDYLGSEGVWIGTPLGRNNF